MGNAAGIICTGLEKLSSGSSFAQTQRGSESGLEVCLTL